MEYYFQPAFEQLRRISVDLVSALPNILMGFLVFLLFYWFSGRVRALVNRLLARGNRSVSVALVFSRMARFLTVLAGLLVALTIILPSFNPAQLIELLGITSVAIGFAFRDILQNFLAGVILLLTEPFKIGDQIKVKEFEGTIEDVKSRATYIRTYDGRRVVIPNATLLIDTVTVNTAFPTRRTEYTLGIGYGDDIEQAQRLILEAVAAVEGVLQQPPPDVLVIELAESTVNMRVRWWTEPMRADVLRVQDRVLTGIKSTLTANGIDIPFPTQVVLFHDQTEETDGNRALQREGWPAGTQIPPAPKTIAGAILKGGGDAANRETPPQ